MHAVNTWLVYKNAIRTDQKVMSFPEDFLSVLDKEMIDNQILWWLLCMRSCCSTTHPHQAIRGLCDNDTGTGASECNSPCTSVLTCLRPILSKWLKSKGQKTTHCWLEWSDCGDSEKVYHHCVVTKDWNQCFWSHIACNHTHLLDDFKNDDNGSN